MANKYHIVFEFDKDDAPGTDDQYRYSLEQSAKLANDNEFVYVEGYEGWRVEKVSA